MGKINTMESSSREDLSEVFAELAEMAKSGEKEKIAIANETAWDLLKDLVYKIYHQSFKAADLDDMRQEAALAICQYLPNYDKEKGMPSTYFTPHIKHAMAVSSRIEPNGGTTIHYSRLKKK